ncbi:MAG: FHA domain-containing protein [Acidimicrobiales bacterium]
MTAGPLSGLLAGPAVGSSLLAAAIPTPLLTILKYCLLALLWLFFLRVLRAVWAEVKRARAPEPAPHPSPGPAGVPAPAPPPAGAPESDHRGALLHLAVVEPPERRGHTFELGPEVTVGRAPGCGVALPEDSFTSHLHARVWQQDGELWVEDLGSTNGTYLNKRKLTGPATLSRGDRLQVGRTVLEVSR